MAADNQRLIEAYLRNGGRVTVCPPINQPSDREAVNARRNIRPPQAKPEERPLTSQDCEICERVSGRNDRRCLRCPKYKQFRKEFDGRDQMAFDHLPAVLYEQAADVPRPDIVQRIRQLPLKSSVPLMMQYFLGAGPKEIADYLKISRQTVTRQNKKSIIELRLLISS